MRPQAIVISTKVFSKKVASLYSYIQIFIHMHVQVWSWSLVVLVHIFITFLVYKTRQCTVYIKMTLIAEQRLPQSPIIWYAYPPHSPTVLIQSCISTSVGSNLTNKLSYTKLPATPKTKVHILPLQPLHSFNWHGKCISLPCQFKVFNKLYSGISSDDVHYTRLNFTSVSLNIHKHCILCVGKTVKQPCHAVIQYKYALLQ